MPGTRIDGLVTASGARWAIREGQAADIGVDSDISYGHEYQSVRFRGAGGRARLATTPLSWKTDEVVTLDLDIFLKSDGPHVQLVPVGQAVGTDEVGFAVRDPRTTAVWSNCARRRHVALGHRKLLDGHARRLRL